MSADKFKVKFKITLKLLSNIKTCFKNNENDIEQLEANQ